MGDMFVVLSPVFAPVPFVGAEASGFSVWTIISIEK